MKKQGLSQLIEALQIFLKYGDIAYPTHCEHDEMTVCVDPAKVSDEDKKKLDELGFFESDEDCFKSFKYGSA
jgi:hypothetical protein